MSRYVLDNMFRLVDVDKNNVIDSSEWTSFFRVFLKPFFECSTVPNPSNGKKDPWAISKIN